MSFYDPKKPISGVRVYKVDTTAGEMDWKKLRGVESLTFDFGSNWANGDVVKLDSLTSLVGPFDDADLKNSIA